MTIADSIEGFKDYIATERRMAQGTIKNYIGDLQDLLAFVEPLGVSDVQELTARDIRAWQLMHIELGETPGTVRRRMSSVGSWVRWLRSTMLLDTDLMARVVSPKLPKRKPVFFKVNELEHLYDRGVFGEDFVGQRNALILRMLYETGIRRSELVGLKESSVDLTALTVKVLGKRSKARIVPIEKEMAHNISNYITLKRKTVSDTEWLFVTPKGRKITVDQVYYVVKKYMVILSHADRISPHVFRHSFATHILGEGGNLMAIKDLLGHESLATTEIYAHVTREQLKEVYRLAHPRGRTKSVKKV